jgi:hypothetical protein
MSVKDAAWTPGCICGALESCGVLQVSLECNKTVTVGKSSKAAMPSHLVHPFCCPQSYCNVMAYMIRCPPFSLHHRGSGVTVCMWCLGCQPCLLTTELLRFDGQP